MWGRGRGSEWRRGFEGVGARRGGDGGWRGWGEVGVGVGKGVAQQGMMIAERGFHVRKRGPGTMTSGVVME